MSTPPVGTGGEADAGRTPKTLVTVQGASIQIHLWEDRTRGELWVPSYDPAGLSLTSDDYLRIASNNAVDTGCRTFEFLAVAPGTHRLVFEKRLGWKFTAEDRREYLIGVTDGAGGSAALTRV